MEETNAESAAVRSGRLVKWNDERGYGFVSPDDGSGDLFAHISAFDANQRRPEQGDIVFFRTDRSERRAKAVNVRLKALPLPRTVILGYAVGGFCLTIHFLFVFGVIGLQGPVAAYLVMSIITFGFFLADKRRAERAQWRLTETSLHVLEGLGGWPGALIAQAVLRHKTRKPSFQRILWYIVAIHFGMWATWYLRQSLSG